MDTPFGTFSLTGDAVPVPEPQFQTLTPFGSFGLGNDMVESVQMQPFIPAVAQQQGMPWYESVIAYGLTRAIDNRFGPPQVGGNTQAGSFAGQSGRTYVNTPNARAGQVAQPQAMPSGGGLLALAAAAAFAFL